MKALSRFVSSCSRFSLALLLTLLATVMFASVGVAQSSGNTPYAVLYAALKPALEVRRFDRLEARSNVQSKSPTVRPDQIRMEIRSKAGLRKLSVAANGDFEFPLDDALLSENPEVVSNQPKGSLTLSVTIMLRPFPTLRVPYRELTTALAQVEAFIASDPGKHGVGVRGVEFNFEPGHQVTVELRGRSEQMLMADDFGRVLLIDAEEWHRPDVEVAFSEPPLRILPYLDLAAPK